MELTPATKIHDLLQRYPFLVGFLASYRPEMAKLNQVLVRNTLGRVATLEMAARTAGVPVDRLIADLQVQLNRLGALKEIILDLHAGVDLDEAKRRFADAVKDVDHAEIAALEQQLIKEGLPESEVKRLCDVHVALFKDSLEREQERRKVTLKVPSGHPVHTFRAENEALGRIVEEMRATLSQLTGPDGLDEARLKALRAALARLSEVERHYLRKENQLFPALEARGFEGPTKVMWALHDDLRALLKSFRALLEQAEPDPQALKEEGERFLVMLSDLIYKEEHILFPTALDLLDEQDWVRIRQGEDDVGYALGVRPGDAWEFSRVAQDGSEIIQERFGGVSGAATGGLSGIPLDTGLLSPEQVNLLLRRLPVDVSFVDEHDEVRYYSEGERIFPRSPGIIGRKVQNCHPPQSVHVVQKILDEFRAGAKDVAEFWLSLNSKFVHIRYFALRDREGKYKGTLEVVQDVTKIRELAGERRLLDW
jgi:DUF438 domain-containing protein